MIDICIWTYTYKLKGRLQLIKYITFAHALSILFLHVLTIGCVFPFSVYGYFKHPLPLHCTCFYPFYMVILIPWVQKGIFPYFQDIQLQYDTSLSAFFHSNGFVIMIICVISFHENRNMSKLVKMDLFGKNIHGKCTSGLTLRNGTSSKTKTSKFNKNNWKYEQKCDFLHYVYFLPTTCIDKMSM